LPNLFHQNTIITVSNEDALAFILHPSATKATKQQSNKPNRWFSPSKIETNKKEGGLIINQKP